MKLNKEEFKKKYSDMITDNDDLLIPLLEDIEDSVDVADTREEVESLENELKELKQKYKDRFLNKVEEIEEVEKKLDEKEAENISEEGLKEEEVIDIKEI